MHRQHRAPRSLQHERKRDRLLLAAVEQSDLAEHGHREVERERRDDAEHAGAAALRRAQKGAVVAAVCAPLRAAEVEVDAEEVADSDATKTPEY